MKTVKTYRPYLADCGEPDMTPHPRGGYVSYLDYMELYKKYIRARATVNKNKIKSEIKNKNLKN
jgi:hypothetical protein